MNPGSIVRFRKRDWVLLPSDREEVVFLRPLTGTSDDLVAVHRQLADLLGYTLPTERIELSQFPPPSADSVADAQSLHLLWQAARLLLREGATPFRSLGRVSVRPRTYQLVPLMMALRLDPVRLLIADDVGVGKTIEAGLIARELWEQGEVRRLAVLCPPYLCDQWRKELTEKFHLEAVVVSSGTVGQLERHTPPGRTVYQHYPVQVISIDFVKYPRNKPAFLLHAPELIRLVHPDHLLLATHHSLIYSGNRAFHLMKGSLLTPDICEHLDLAVGGRTRAICSPKIRARGEQKHGTERSRYPSTTR